MPPGHPWWGNPKFDIRYDVAAGKKLMEEAGHTPAKPLKVKVQISASGSGQMQPLPMNELVKSNMEAAGFKVTFEVMDWNTLVTSWRAGAKDPASRGAHSTNSSYFSQDPFTALIRHLDSSLVPPKSSRIFTCPGCGTSMTSKANVLSAEWLRMMVTRIMPSEEKLPSCSVKEAGAVQV